MTDHTLKTTEKPCHQFISDDERKYMGLVQHQIQPFFAKFAAAITEQSPSFREQGRCALVDFTPQGHHITSFASSTELNASLIDTSPPPYHVFDQLPRRR